MVKAIFDPPDGLEECVFLKEQSERLARGEFTETITSAPDTYKGKNSEEAARSLQDIQDKIEHLKAKDNAKNRKNHIEVFIDRFVAPIIVTVFGGLILAHFQEISSFVIGVFLELVDWFANF